MALDLALGRRVERVDWRLRPILHSEPARIPCYLPRPVLRRLKSWSISAAIIGERGSLETRLFETLINPCLL